MYMYTVNTAESIKFHFVMANFVTLKLTKGCYIRYEPNNIMKNI